MKYIIIICMLLVCIKARSQVFEDICATPDNPFLKSSTIMNIYDYDKEPIKTINIRLIFLRKDDGSGGFQQSNSDHQQYISDLINNLNSIYSNLQSQYDNECYDGSQGLKSDSKIRFDVETMYLNNTSAWNNYGYAWCPGSSSFSPYLVSLNQQLVNSSSEPRINVFFTEDATAITNIVENGNCPYQDLGFTSVSCSQFPSTNLQLNQCVHMRNKFVKYYWMMNCVVGNVCNNPEWVNNPPTESTVYGWLNVGRGLAHEIGHSLNLYHTSPNTCVCAKHLMMNQGCGWGKFISPNEVEKIHDATFFTSLRKYIDESTYSNMPYNFTQSESWSGDIRIYRGINLTNNVMFSVYGNLTMPSQSSLIIQSGQLKLENCNLAAADGGSLTDIELNGNCELINSEINSCNSISTSSGNILLDNSSITLNQNGNMDISSAANIELESNSSILLKQDADLTLDGSSTFTLESGCTLEIEDGAKFIVKNDAQLQVNSGANIIIHGTGAIIVHCYGKLCASSGANINLQDLESGIHFNDQAWYVSGCLFDISSIITGSGSVMDHGWHITLDNETITSDRFVVGNVIQATDVTVQSGNVIFDAQNGIDLNEGFEVQLGAEFRTQSTVLNCND